MTEPDARIASEDDTTVPEPDADARPRGQLSILKLLAAGGMARLVVLPVTGIANLVISRLITDAVGVQQFGAVMLIATLSQMLVFADLGASAAVASATAQLDGSKARTRQFRRTLLTALRVMALAAAALVLIAVTVAVLLDWSTVLGIDRTQTGGLSANVATVIALVAFAVSLLFALGEPLQRGRGHLHRAVLLVGVAAPSALVITLVMRLLGASEFAYATAIPIGAALGLLCCAGGALVSMRPLLRGMIGEVLHPRRFPGAKIFATAAPSFVIMIGLPLALQTDRLIISHRGDPDALSTYSYAVQLYLPIWSVVSVAALSLWPVFARSGTTGAGVRRGWLTAVAVLTGIGLLFALAYLVLAPVIIGWMSAGSAHPPWSLILSFAALLAVQAAHVGSGVMLIAPHQLRFQALCVLALVLTNLPLSWALTPPLGATGPVLASAITVALCQLLPGFLVAWRFSRQTREHPQGRT